MKFTFIKQAFISAFIIITLLQFSCKQEKRVVKKDGFAKSEQFADSLISRLSLKQKIALLHGMGGGNSEFGDLDIRFFGIKGNKEHGIPSLHMGHGITGVRSGRDTAIHATYFKTPIAMGCTWDTSLYSDVGVAIAKEMRGLGQDLNLGPTLNIIRHPLGGRNWESYSEDPHLTSRLAVSFIKAMQSNGIICGPKHFVANNQETNRFDINNEVEERTLREIYLPAFKSAITEGGALNIMGAYNRVNGDFMCHHEYLLNDVLRKEWGFKGFLLSDFAFGIKNTTKAIKAGMNVEMHRPKYYGDALLEEIEKGTIQEGQINLLLKDVLKVMHYMNIFDREKYENKPIVHSKKHIELTREIAQNAAVLLKNEKNILPIKSEIASVAIIGPNAKRFPTLSETHKDYAYYLQGGGSGRTYYYHNTLVEPYTGLKNAFNNKTKITYAQGCKTPDLFVGDNPLEFDKEEQNLIKEAVSIAKTSEMAVLYVGLSGVNESEGLDRTKAELPGYQEQLIQEVAKVNSNTIVVLISGGYVDVSKWINDVSALLFAPYCGEQIGNGIADVITGKVSPSGKLPFTWPVHTKDYPENTLFNGGFFSEEGKSNVYKEGIFVGYRWFDKKEIPVQFPFGYGLSYTAFNYEKIEVVDDDKWPKQLKVTIKNTGNTIGKEVVQVYVKDIKSSVPRPKKELKGFAKVNIKPTEQKEVLINLSKRDFSFYSPTDKQWILESGEFEILVGSSAQDIHQKITLLL